MILRVDPNYFVAAVIAAKEQFVRAANAREFRIQLHPLVYAGLGRNRFAYEAVTNAGPTWVSPKVDALAACAWDAVITPRGTMEYPIMTVRGVILEDKATPADPLTDVRFDLSGLGDSVLAVPGPVREVAEGTDNAGEDPHERGYIEGRRAFAREMAQLVRGELGALGKSLSNLEAERDEARSVLRRLCEDHGDNDWDDDLHLADALDKHLGRYLDE